MLELQDQKDIEIWKKSLKSKRKMIKENIWTDKEQDFLDQKVNNIIEASWGKALMDDYPNQDH